MLSSQDFEGRTAGAVLFLHVTSRVKTDPHQELLREKGGRGFPYLAVMDAEGEVIATPAVRTIASFESVIGKAARYLQLVQRDADGDEDVEFDLFVSRMELGLLTYKQARSGKSKLRGLTEEQKDALAVSLLELQVTEVCRSMRSNKDRVQAGAQFYRMWRKKSVPRDREVAGSFYEQITYFAEKQKNIKLFREAMDRYAVVAPEGDTKDRVLGRMNSKLRKLRS